MINRYLIKHQNLGFFSKLGKFGPYNSENVIPFVFPPKNHLMAFPKEVREKLRVVVNFGTEKERELAVDI